MTENETNESNENVNEGNATANESSASENVAAGESDVAENAAAEESSAGASPERTPTERGVLFGEKLAAMEAETAAQAASPAGKADDRKRHVGIIVAVVAFAVLLIGAGIAYSALAPQTENEKVEITGTDAVHTTEADPGDDTGDGNGANATTPAPDFTMTDADGQKVQLSDFKGRPVLLNFWASWCGPCVSEMPEIQAAYERAGKDVEFVIVNMTGMNGETEQAAQAFLTEKGYTFPVYFDASNSAATAFAVTSIPQTYLINADGDIIGAYMGAMDASIIDQGIAMLTGNADVAQ